MPAKQRDPSFDILKGIGIIMVVVGHYSALNPVIFNVIFSVHMPLFFIVAGYFLKPNTDLFATLRKDVKRLIMPYLLTMVVLIAYNIVVHGLLYHEGAKIVPILRATIFPSLLRMDPDCPSIPVWFLLALFWARETSNLVLSRLRHPVILLCVFSMAVTCLYNTTAMESPLSVLQGLSAILFVMAGYLMKQCPPPPRIFVTILPFWLLAIAFAEINMIGCHYRLFPLAVVGACCGTYVLLYTSRCVAGRWPDTRVVRFVEWYGAGSLVVLCAHTVERYIGVWRFLHIESPWIIIPLQIALYAAALAVVHRVAWLRRLFGLQH